MKAFVLDPNSVIINIIEIEDGASPSSFSAIVFKEPESNFINIGWQLIDGNWHVNGLLVDWEELLTPPEPLEYFPEEVPEEVAEE